MQSIFSRLGIIAIFFCTNALVLPAQQKPVEKPEKPGVGAKAPAPFKGKRPKKPKPNKGLGKINKSGAKVKSKIKQAREEFRDGRRNPTNILVEVFLRNREKFTGIVRHGRFVELRKGRGYVAAKKTTFGAGMRLWYFNDTSSEIFIKYKDIIKYNYIRRLSDLQVEDMGRKIRKRETAAATKSREKAKARLQALKAKQEMGDKLEDLAKEIEVDEKESAARAERAKLLKEFPPGDGWGATRIKEINMRKISLGVYPNKQELRFIENYTQWKQALAEAKTEKDKEKNLKEALEKAKQGTGKSR